MASTCRIPSARRCCAGRAAAARAAAKARLFRRKWLGPATPAPPVRSISRASGRTISRAYISIFVTGHLLAPVLIVLASDFALSSTAILAIILPLAVAFMLLTLQPAKGAVIALQWWHGMHGFRAERRPQPGDDA